MIETQAGINEWAEATFGPCPDIRRMVARANEEMSELLSQITMPEPDGDKIAEECADICGPLFRVAAWANEDLMPIFALANLMVPGEVYGPAVRANGIMAFILERLSISNVVERRDVGRQIAMIVIKLAEICAAVGIPLGEAIDRKMVICRARDWQLDGSGFGYHTITPAEVRAADQSITPWHDHTCAPMISSKPPEVVGELYQCGHLHSSYEAAQQCHYPTRPAGIVNRKAGT